MIIFDLDGCLADNRHRRHLIDPSNNVDYQCWKYSLRGSGSQTKYFHKETKKEFEPNWVAYWDACDMDEPIKFTVSLLHNLFQCERNVSIWTGRSEIIWAKTEEWLLDNIEMKFCMRFNPQTNLKMCPEGEICPDEVLFERWLDQLMGIGEKLDPNQWHDIPDKPSIKTIKMAFSGNPAVIQMWKRRGVPCFQVHV